MPLQTVKVALMYTWLVTATAVSLSVIGHQFLYEVEGEVVYTGLWLVNLVKELFDPPAFFSFLF